MKILLLLLALTGFTSGLTSNLEYVYRYFGSVATGINELSPQAAGTAIKADIIIQMQNDGSALIKLRNVRLAEFNEKLGCDSRGEIPVPFKSVATINEKLHLLIETPFKAHFFDKSKHAIEVDSSESVWLSNVRKAIVSHLKIELLKANFDTFADDIIASRIHSGKVPHVFHLQEETIMGRCRVDYAVHKLREDLSLTRSYNFDQSIKDDVERGDIESSALTSKTSQKTTKTGTSKTTKTAPITKTKPPGTKNGKPAQLVKKIKQDLWHVIRSIDFNKCDDRVFLQVTPIGFKSSMGDGQHEWLRGRSSVSEYILRGSGGHFRVERAVVEGGATMAPFGMKTELLQARTNQTFQLVAVRKIKDNFKLPTNPKHITSWMQEVLSFAAYPTINKAYPWITFSEKESDIRNIQTFGMEPFKPEDKNHMKEWVIKYLKNASEILTDIDQAFSKREPGITIEYLQKSSQLMNELSKEEILEIFDLFFNKQIHHNEVLGAMLAIDAAAASGSYYAVEAIIDYMKAGKLPDLKIMTIFMTLTNHAECPENIPSLMDYVLKLDLDEKPFLASTVLVNFANFAHQMCISENAKEVRYGKVLFGDLSCGKGLIKDRFLPYLENIIFSDAATWKKEVAVEALGRLATPLAVPILTSVILFDKKNSNRLRKTAIFALEAWQLDQFESSNIRENVLELLTDIYTNVGEKPDVRQAALYAIPSWSPDASFWYQVARLTWREPSRQMASFMTFLLESYGNFIHPNTIKLNQAASHALKFSRPVAPSDKYSFVYMAAADKAKHYISKFAEVAWFSNTITEKPIDIYGFLWTYLGGFQMAEFEIALMTEGLFKDFDNILGKKEGKGTASGAAIKIAQRFYKIIQESIQVETIQHDKNDSLNLFLRFFEHIHILFPINEHTMQTLPIGDATDIAALVLQLTLGYDSIHGKFFNPIRGKTFQPTELGLPLFGRISNPMVLTEVSLTTLNLRDKTPSLEALKKIEVSSEVLLNFASESKSSLEVLIPWTNSLVGTGTRSTRDIVIPIDISYRRDQGSEGETEHETSRVKFKSNYLKKFSVIRATNLPYTSIAPIIPIPESRKANIKPILNSPPKEKKIHFPTTFTGLQFDLSWSSEMRFPFNGLDVNKFLGGCSNLDASPWLMYTLASPTVQMWYLNIEFDPSTSDTKDFCIECSLSSYGTEKISDQITQQRGGDDYTQVKQDSFDQYHESQDFEIDQGFQQASLGPPQIPPEAETFGGQVTYGDTQQRRVEKLQQQFEGVVESMSCKFDFTGANPRSYEFMFTHSKPEASQTRKLQKSQLSFFRGPIPGRDPKSASIYLDIKKSTPAFSHLDTLQSLFSTNLDTELQAEVTIHPSKEPVFSLKGNFRLSEAWKARYQKELTETCDFDSYNPLYAFHANAVYDLIKLTASWKKVCDFSKFPILSTLFELLDDGLITHTNFVEQKCGPAVPVNKVTVDVHRSPNSGKWFVAILHGDFKLELDSLDSCPLVNQYLSIGKKGQLKLHPDHYTTFNYRSNKCAIKTTKTTNQVRTFDGYTYNVKLSDCWTVAAHDCSIENSWFLLVRNSQGERMIPEVKYVDILTGVVVEIKGHVLVNGKKIDPVGDSDTVLDSNGEVLVTVFKKDDFFKVQFEKHFSVVVKEDVQIKVPKTLAGSTCGLCGNYDGEPEGELIGPHRCIYGNPNTFAASWMAESDTCDSYTILEKRQDADDFQKVCKKIDALHETYPYYEERGFLYEWATILSEKGDYCISAMPIRFCKDDTISFHAPKMPIKFRCYPKETAPKLLIEACNKKSKYTKANLGQFDGVTYDEIMHIPIPVTCIK